MVDELKKTGVVDDRQARELVDKLRPTINVDKGVSSTQDALALVANEAAVNIPGRVEKRIRDVRRRQSLWGLPPEEMRREGESEHKKRSKRL